MKDSQIYKKLQKMVVISEFLSAEEKIAMMRLLFEQEDLALYAERCENREADADGTV